jgi:hypothetical protein
MQNDEARKIREEWGGKPCDHPELEKEYYLGADTKDYVCTTCGSDFTRKERDELLLKKASRE